MLTSIFQRWRMQPQPHWKPSFYCRYFFSRDICKQHSDCFADNIVSSSREALPRVRRTGWLKGILLSRPTDGGKSLSMWSVAEPLKACCEASLTTPLLFADFHLLFSFNDPWAQWKLLFLRKLHLSMAAVNKQFISTWSTQIEQKSNPLFFC